jgi:hypothetical protein
MSADGNKSGNLARVVTRLAIGIMTLGLLGVGVPALAQSSKPAPRRSLADLLNVPDAAARWMADVPRIRVDDAKATAAGIRKLAGQRLTLYTDLPADAEVDILPTVFDQAFPQWCDYFGKKASEQADWRMTGFLIKDRERFEQAGLLPPDLPPFENGFCRNYELWLYEQPSVYYRRHLLLHEGTHGFMNTILGGCGPAWYMEAMAELLATHRWHQGHLTLEYLPATRNDVDLWGRIKIIEDAYAARRAKTLKSVVEQARTSQWETEMYAWCWAVGTLLDRHPRYQARFRQLAGQVLQPDFNERFYHAYAADWSHLAEEWQVMVANLDYGYDVGRMAIDFTPGKPLSAAGAKVTVAADRGWQNSGLRLEAGVKYQLRAAGRYQVADRPQIWWCEPGGVSIRYCRGQPLGILLAAIRPDEAASGPSPLIRPLRIGLGTTLAPERSGTLFLRINDSAGELSDNAGSLVVELSRGQ